MGRAVMRGETEGGGGLKEREGNCSKCLIYNVLSTFSPWTQDYPGGVVLFINFPFSTLGLNRTFHPANLWSHDSNLLITFTFLTVFKFLARI